ncbi:processive diacylglycerol beta-glucosyltransferase (plasmid) [Serratia marcescens]|nr:processive diacylglycerol beta-glucosyltransferase [Serratia marcescens]
MVLILYVESGTGSFTLAKNVQHALNSQGIDNQIISLHDLLPEWLNQLLFGHYKSWCIEDKQYFRSIFKMRWFYPVLYKLLPIIMYCKGMRHRAQFPPQFEYTDAIVNCSFFCGWFSRYWINKAGRDIPVYGVLGDYTVSPGWQLKIDRLFVPFDFQSQIFKAIRHKGGKVTTSGIPAHINQVRSAGDKGCVMLGGGGWGLQISARTIKMLLTQPLLTRLIVLCGKNNELYDDLSSRFQSEINHQRLEVHAYTEKMPDIYARASIVATKSGGLTLTEAALSGKPIIITGYLPGHEEDNMRIFLQNNAALYAENDKALVNAIQILLTDNSKAIELKSNAAKLVNDQAGYFICNIIKKDLRHVET